MQEQQINQKYCPPQNQRLEQVDNVLQSKQRSEQIANRRLKQLHRFLPQTFTPYMNIANHYYNQQHHQSNIQSNTIRLYNGHPQFSLNSLIYDRQRLSLQRQMMYCRGAVLEEIMSEDVVENMITESSLQRGYVHKSGNKSVIVDGMLVYVHGETIKAVVIPWYKCSNNNRAIQVYDQSMNSMTLYTFPTGTVILQLHLISTNNIHQHFDSNKKTSNNNKHSNNNLNNHHFNNNPIILSLRLSRQIVIFNVSQQRIIHSIQTQSNNQFIGSQKSIYNVDTIETIEYDGFHSKIRRWDLGYNNNSKNHYNYNGSLQQLNSQSQQLLALKGTLVHSMNKLTRNQTILATYQGLSMCDYRQKHVTTLYSVLNKDLNSNKKYNNSTINSNDRIYSAIKIHSNFTYSPYLVTCNTRHLCLFDVRNLSQPVQRRLHHFQQAPPQNMCYFDGFQERLDTGVIVGWNSWGKYGAGIITEVNINGFFNNSKELKQQGKREQSILGKHFQLLSPENISNKKQNINTSSYLSSISLYNYSPQSLALFSTTNQGTINIHLYHHNSLKQKYQPQQILFEQSQKQKMIKSLENNEGHSSQRWLKANLCDKYFTKVVEYQKIAQQSKQGEKTAKPQPTINNKKKKKAKTNSTSLIINKDKKKKKHSNNNKSINEDISKNNIEGQNQNVDGQIIDDQQLLLDTGEYQNQQKCEQSYSKRKLNFADLTKFYTTLKLKARQLQQQNSAVSKNNINTNNYSKNDFSSSLTSTQPYSQSFSLSQSFSDDFFKTYTFHNKKVLNTSMLDKLKTQWQL